jgi:ABC-type transport system involved in multi-copper enzyme maturation permease subunit
MTFLPIVERELRVTARLPATFRNRTLTAGVVAAVAFVMILLSSMTGSPAFIGGASFQTLAYMTLCFCLLEGLRKTADCVSEEKREGTLGLLFLTDLRGYDVVLGKLAATSLNSFYGLLAILPVLAMPLLLGGVTAGEYWRVVLTLLNILFFSLCAGLVVSSCSTGQQWATGATLAVILLICAGPFLTFTKVLYPLSPLYGFHTAFAGYYAGGHAGYWRAFGITQLWSWLMLAWASLAAPRSWQETETSGQWSAIRRWLRWFNWRLGRNESREEMLERNPVLWLAARGQGLTLVLNLFVVIAVTQAAIFGVVGRPEFLRVFVYCAVALNYVVKILLAGQAARFFAEARQENALEMLLGTPLTKEQIVNGQIQALERLFLVPVLIILLAEFSGGLVASFATHQAYQWQPSNDLVEFLIGSLVYLALFCADAAAVIWAGMYFGLTSKKPSQAATKTVLFVLVMPLVTLVLGCLGLPFFIACPIFWTRWGKSKLESSLRELVGDRYALNPVAPYRWPAPGSGPPPMVPPPIINQQPRG